MSLAVLCAELVLLLLFIDICVVPWACTHLLIPYSRLLPKMKAPQCHTLKAGQHRSVATRGSSVSLRALLSLLVNQLCSVLLR